MFALVAVGLLVLAGAFVAGALSRLTKPRPVEFAAPKPRKRVIYDPNEPQVWDRNLVGADYRKPAATPSETKRPAPMGNWD